MREVVAHGGSTVVSILKTNKGSSLAVFFPDLIR